MIFQTDVKVNLIKDVIISDAIGNQIKTIQKRAVYAQFKTIGQKEYFNARTSGMNAEIKAVVFTGDYEFERRLEYNNKFYNIYRYYMSGDKTELYLEDYND